MNFGRDRWIHAGRFTVLLCIHAATFGLAHMFLDVEWDYFVGGAVWLVVAWFASLPPER